jgi:hypothetical protein
VEKSDFTAKAQRREETQRKTGVHEKERNVVFMAFLRDLCAFTPLR